MWTAEISDCVHQNHLIEARLSVCDKLAETIDASLKQAESLRQSILKKAFTGQLLTPAERATCRAEPDWCPARELVARPKTGTSMTETNTGMKTISAPKGHDIPARGTAPGTGAGQTTERF